MGLGIKDAPNMVKGGEKRDPPLTRPKKRPLVIFGGGSNTKAWNTSLLDSLTAELPNVTTASNYRQGQQQEE